MNDEGLPAMSLWLISFGLGGAGGLCWLVRSPLVVTPRLLMSAIINSGLCGLTTLLLFHHWLPSMATSLSLAGLVGLGGVPTVELLAKVAYNLLDRYGKKAVDSIPESPDPRPSHPPSPGGGHSAGSGEVTHVEGTKTDE